MSELAERKWDNRRVEGWEGRVGRAALCGGRNSLEPFFEDKFFIPKNAVYIYIYISFTSRISYLEKIISCYGSLLSAYMLSRCQCLVVSLKLQL